MKGQVQTQDICCDSWIQFMSIFFLNWETQWKISTKRGFSLVASALFFPQMLSAQCLISRDPAKTLKLFIALLLYIHFVKPTFWGIHVVSTDACLKNFLIYKKSGYVWVFVSQKRECISVLPQQTQDLSPEGNLFRICANLVGRYVKRNKGENADRV